jgi:hypothetical protein
MEEKGRQVEPEMKQQKDEGQNRKRKRGASNLENARSKEDSTIETEKIGGDVVQTMTPVSNGSIESSSPTSKPLQGEKRLNPFALPSTISLKATENSLNLTPPLSSPQVSTSTPSPTKKVIQFQDDDSDDDSGQFLHPAKRKVSAENLSSPRLSQTSKVALASPKKIPSKVLLLRRKQELEEERKNLPIWSGTLSQLLIY